MNVLLKSPYGILLQRVAERLGVQVVSAGSGHGQSVPCVYFALRLPGLPEPVRWLRSLRRTQESDAFEELHIEGVLERLLERAKTGAVEVNQDGFYLS